MEWFYEIRFCNQVLSVSSKGFSTSKEAEIEAALIINRMSKVSGSYYEFSVFLGELSL